MYNIKSFINVNNGYNVYLSTMYLRIVTEINFLSLRIVTQTPLDKPHKTWTTIAYMYMENKHHM